MSHKRRTKSYLYYKIKLFQNYQITIFEKLKKFLIILKNRQFSIKKTVCISFGCGGWI